MAFDGFTTAALVHELNSRLSGGRIYKIIQSESDELLLTIKPAMEQGGGQVRLLMSADPSLPLCYLTQSNKPAPKTAPAFSMLLRKYLQNGRIVSITQPGLERIIRMDVEHLNEMGDLCSHTLLIELMGKHSNIIFLDNDTIVDSIRRVSSMVSSVREVLPGRSYFIPQTQNKRDPLKETRQTFFASMEGVSMRAPDWLTRSFTGFSSLISEEVTFRARLSQDRSISEFTDEEKLAFWTQFSGITDAAREGRFEPVIYYHMGVADMLAQGEPVDYCAFQLRMYKDLPGRRFAGMSELLENFYAEKNALTRLRQKSADLRHVVQTILERDTHKYDLQRRQLQDTAKRDKYRIYGELLNTYGYSVPEGASSVELDNYYTGGRTTVPLDPTRTAQQNAQKYFDRYTKLKRTEQALSELITQVKDEIDQLRSIRTSLDLSVTEDDLAQIRRELEDSGFVKKHSTPGKGKGAARVPKSKPLHYISRDGLDIYVGKNNTQNDEITFHLASGSDIWFHANDIPGSHVILRTGGRPMSDIPDSSFEDAARLAAWYSSARTEAGNSAAGKVEVDYIERRNLKKPGGARPGFVVYYTNYSILVPADITGIRLADEVS